MRARSKSVASMAEYFDDDDDVRSSCSSARSSTMRLTLVEDLEDDDENDVPRVRRCSHGKRISFDDDVKIETIPSRDSLDEATKKTLWYTHDEFLRMQEG
ncbi:hypothetical protein SPRG_04570 [Saprolegnia parasitica CBS 223.65]|uniref:Uncharacterized protein n=1 Tax=Saprolegnia parasitica (strain CBS 223.65) TaxID=695850 RepID=A0A067CIZ3_SAPPC|nr:hypothetical protein SPRG_04570 [Saprolegnia parasitica CBS 223.65]KDO30669.1 hypothetical protein SPRG_04570 [Saprolegnia parasitica CBS 223.65]|eukprot:XP_012198373.1 hypothetical protein SPRG_04570 [Saprolegnia parasitica CBS 223.65]